MGSERMLGDLWVAPPGGDWGVTWVAPPGGYLRYLGPSPLTAVQGVLHFSDIRFLFVHPVLRIKLFLLVTHFLRHQARLYTIV